MDQLTILVELSELRLLRDLSELAKARKAVSIINEKSREIHSSLERETKGTAGSMAGDQSTATAYAAYVDNARRRLAFLKVEKMGANTAEAAFRQAAIRAQGRVRAIELLQKQSRERQQTVAERRDESTGMSCLVSRQQAFPSDR